MVPNRAAIEKTLLYSDLFDYPLKKEEIWRYLISSNKTSKNLLDKLIKENSSIHRLGKYYFINKRREIVSIRTKREKLSREKIIYARKLVKKLSIVPTVMLIGISGSLSVNNSEKDDDIDLFIISSKNSVWTTRFILILFLLMGGKYRRRNDIQIAGKFCLNMIMDETVLELPKKRHDLYTAHEVSQMLPVFSRNNTYDHFLEANKWVLGFMTNSLSARSKYVEEKDSLVTVFLRFIIGIFKIEKIARTVQKAYMHKRTNETVSDNFLAFHPIDSRSTTLRKFTKLVKF